MAKFFRVGFFVSLALNVILVVGFVVFRNSTSQSFFKIGVLHAEDKATTARHILNELESGDPNKIAHIKDYLRNNLELCNTEAEEYRRAAAKN